MSGLFEDPNNYGEGFFGVTTPPSQWQSGPGHYLFEDTSGGTFGTRQEFFSLFPLSGSQDFDLELTGHDNDVIFEIIEIDWVGGSPGVGGYEEAGVLFTTTLTGDGTTSHSFTLGTPNEFLVRASTVGGFSDYISATSQLILLPGGGTSTPGVFWSNRVKTTEVLL